MFYSEDLIRILNEFTDMSERCYRINLPDASKKYYNIYNLKDYHLINRKELDDCSRLPCRIVIGKEDLGPVFAVSSTNCKMVSEELMQAMTKAKLTDVEFEECIGYTPEEALEWARENPELAGDFVDQEWFQKMLDECKTV